MANLSVKKDGLASISLTKSTSADGIKDMPKPQSKPKPKPEPKQKDLTPELEAKLKKDGMSRF